MKKDVVLKWCAPTMKSEIMYEGEPKEEKTFRNCPSFFFTRLGGNVIEIQKKAAPGNRTRVDRSWARCFNQLSRRHDWLTRWASRPVLLADFQSGQGFGHGFLAFIEIQKKAAPGIRTRVARWWARCFNQLSRRHNW